MVLTKHAMNPKVDWFFTKAKTWQEEYDRLRMIVLGCGLTEELKWGCPCYTCPTGHPGGRLKKVTLF